MSDTVIVAICSLVGTGIGCFSGMRLVTYRIEQLEKKVDTHNNFAQRVPLIEEKIKTIEKEIEDIKLALKK